MRLFERVIADNEDGHGSRSVLFYLGPRGGRGDSRAPWKFLPLIVLASHRGWGDRWLEFTAYPLRFGPFGSQHSSRLTLPLTRSDAFASYHLGTRMLSFTGGCGKSWSRAT